MISRKTGNPLPRRPANERFDEKVLVDTNSGCWIWKGAIDRCGYGRFGENYKTHQAHRWAWEREFGKIPAGLYACHKCDTPACVNPSHIFLGTAADNAADCVSKGRWISRPGSQNPLSKLTEKDVTEIRSMTGTQAQIAQKFGVHQSTISYIKTGKNWRHHA